VRTKSVYVIPEGNVRLLYSSKCTYADAVIYLRWWSR